MTLPEESGSAAPEDQVPGRATKLDRPAAPPPDAEPELPEVVAEVPEGEDEADDEVSELVAAAQAPKPATIPAAEPADEAEASDAVLDVAPDVDADPDPDPDPVADEVEDPVETDIAEPTPPEQTGPRLSRREARTRALEVLFAADVRDAMPSTVLDAEVFVDLFTRRLVDVVVANRLAVDALIGEHAEGWTISRMPAVDRSILRLGTAEMLFVDEVPPKVAIDEAVELAKSLSTDASPKFVNGVLAAIARAHDLV